MGAKVTIAKVSSFLDKTKKIKFAKYHNLKICKRLFPITKVYTSFLLQVWPIITTRDFMIKKIGILKSKSYISSKKPRSSFDKYYIFDKNGTHQKNPKWSLTAYHAGYFSELLYGQYNLICGIYISDCFYKVFVKPTSKWFSNQSKMKA